MFEEWPYGGADMEEQQKPRKKKAAQAKGRADSDEDGVSLSNLGLSPHSSPVGPSK